MPTAKRAATPQILEVSEGQKLAEALHQRLSERAYALFEESGRQAGNDEQNWQRAKSEVLQSLEVRETGSWVALTASLPDISPETIRIYVDWERVLVRAEKNATPSLGQNREHDPSLFLGADLDVTVDPATATAAFKDQVLTLMVKKQGGGSGSRVLDAERLK